MRLDWIGLSTEDVIATADNNAPQISPRGSQSTYKFPMLEYTFLV